MPGRAPLPVLLLADDNNHNNGNSNSNNHNNHNHNHHNHNHNHNNHNNHSDNNNDNNNKFYYKAFQLLVGQAPTGRAQVIGRCKVLSFFQAKYIACCEDRGDMQLSL